LLATLWLVNGVLRLIGVAGMMLFGGMFFPWLRGRIGPDAWPLGPGWGLDSFLSGGFFSLGIFLGLFGLLHLALENTQREKATRKERIEAPDRL